MKKYVLILLLLLSGCNINKVNSNSSSFNNSISTSLLSSISTNKESSSSSSFKNEVSSSSSSSVSSSVSLNESTSTSTNKESSKEESDSSNINICLEKPGGKNEDGSDKLPIPCNKNNKIKIGNDNKTMTSFDFTYSLPDNFRAIYGNNFNNSNNLFYSNGGYEVKMGGPNTPCRGIQTAMFESNLKLEIRVNIGDMFNNTKGNDVDKDLPCMVIYAFDENGKYLRKVEIDTINKNNENKSITKYMNGIDVAYLEIRALQCAYKSSKGYNYALLGLDLIAWPYEYND